MKAQRITYYSYTQTMRKVFFTGKVISIIHNSDERVMVEYTDRDGMTNKINICSPHFKDVVIK